MATGSEHKRRQNQGPEGVVQRGNEQKGPDRDAERALEKVESGAELSSDVAAALVPALGNEAVQALMADAAKRAAEQEAEAAQDQELAEEQEVDEDLELEQVQFGGGGGGAADGNEDPWDVGPLFGGPADPTGNEGPARPRPLARPRMTPDIEEDPDAEIGEAERDADAFTPDDLDSIDDRLPRSAATRPDDRLADDRYAAVEGALRDPLDLGRRAFAPEHLVGWAGVNDPVGRPVEIGRFLLAAAEAPRSRALARALVRGLASWAPEAGGYSGTVARLAHLAVCAEAAEGGGTATDRAVQLALVVDAWPAAVEAARPMARQGMLRAPWIFDSLVPPEADPTEGRPRTPPPSRLAGRALARLVPAPVIPELPTLDLWGPGPRATSDLDDLDAILDAFTTGRDPLAVDPDAPPDPARLQPALSVARLVMGALGRAHVEMAAAAFAVQQVRPEAPARGALPAADRALNQLAVAVLRAGRTLEKLGQRPVSRIPREMPAAALQEIAVAAEALIALRGWVFESVGGALDA